MTEETERLQIGSTAPSPVDDALAESITIIAGVLSSEIIKAALADMEPYTGREVEAARSAFYYVLSMRGDR